MTTDEDRWGEALSILERSPTPSAARRIRRSRTTRWLIVAGSMLVGAAAGLLVFLLVDRHGTTTPHTPLWQEIVGLCICVAGLALDVAGLVLLWRTRRGRSWRRTPTLVLTTRQRRQLLAQVRGRRPADPDRLPLARDLAARLSATYRGLVVLWIGLPVIWIGNAITTPDTWRLVYAAVIVVLMGLAAGFGARDARRAREFLARYPDPDASA